VYALGHLALRREARWLAAVLAYGDGALLCGPVAAMEWWMVAPDEDAEPSVMVVGRQARQRPGTSLHRVARLEPEDVRLRDGIPLTSPARTLLDLAGMWPERPVQLAFDEGRRRGVVTPRAVARVLERYPRRPGAELLRDLARPDRPSELTRSPAEEWLLPHLRRSGLPAPEWNARLGAFTVDCLWRAQRLVVEVDGYPFHTGRSAFERDHEKDLVMRRMRLDVMRFTARQVKREPLRVIVDIAGELARRHPPV
jgi:very-short-patch-repair endonuclease